MTISKIWSYFKENSNRTLPSKITWICRWSIVGFFSLSIQITFFFAIIRPPITLLMVVRQVKFVTQSKPPKFQHHWVSINKISPNLVQAVVASEDNNFMNHHGIDIKAIRDAKKHNSKHKRKRGASTITQQTAKNVFLWPSRNYLRKGAELYFTLLIESIWTKERIMEVYLNMIEMGPNIYGAEAAAKAYFHKPATKLSKAEAALIAASLPNPIKRNPSKPSAYMSQRQQQILQLMRMIGKVEL